MIAVSSTSYDAVVVGAGPAGALTAHLLAVRGARVVMLEAAPAIRRKVCGEYLCPKGVELLETLGLGAIAPGRDIVGMRMVSPSGTVVSARFPDRGGRPSLGPSLGRALDRRVFDGALVDLARSSGARVELGARVTRVARSEDGWVLQTRARAEVRAPLLIGADGRRSVVAKALGLRLPPLHARVALHGHFFHPRKNGAFGEMHILDDGSYIGVDPTGEHEVNVSLVCSAERLRELGGPMPTLQHHLRRAPDYFARFGPYPAHAALHAVSPISHRVASPIAEGAALVGDAAGFLDPLTGEGIYYALFSAHALATALAPVRSFEPAALQSALRAYARQRRRALASKQRLNRGFQSILRRPAMVERLGGALAHKRARADAFIGTIGNVYGPVTGLMRTLSR